MLDVTHSHVDVETEFGVYHWFWYVYTFLLQKWLLAFCKFLETAKDCQLPLSDIYPVWFAVRKVTVLKQ